MPNAVARSRARREPRSGHRVGRAERGERRPLRGSHEAGPRAVHRERVPRGGCGHGAAARGAARARGPAANGPAPREHDRQPGDPHGRDLERELDECHGARPGDGQRPERASRRVRVGPARRARDVEREEDHQREAESPPPRGPRGGGVSVRIRVREGGRLVGGERRLERPGAESDDGAVADHREDRGVERRAARRVVRERSAQADRRERHRGEDQDRRDREHAPPRAPDPARGRERGEARDLDAQAREPRARPARDDAGRGDQREDAGGDRGSVRAARPRAQRQRRAERHDEEADGRQVVPVDEPTREVRAHAVPPVRRPRVLDPGERKDAHAEQRVDRARGLEGEEEADRDPDRAVGAGAATDEQEQRRGSGPEQRLVDGAADVHRDRRPPALESQRREVAPHARRSRREHRADDLGERHERHRAGRERRDDRGAGGAGRRRARGPRCERRREQHARERGRGGRVDRAPRHDRERDARDRDEGARDPRDGPSPAPASGGPGRSCSTRRIVAGARARRKGSAERRRGRAGSIPRPARRWAGPARFVRVPAARGTVLLEGPGPVTEHGPSGSQGPRFGLGPAIRLALEITRRDLALHRRHTRLGILWGVLPPILAMGALDLFLGRIARPAVPGDAPDSLFLYAGLLAWPARARRRGRRLRVPRPRRDDRPGAVPRLVLPFASVLVGIPDLLLGTSRLDGARRGGRARAGTLDPRPRPRGAPRGNARVRDDPASREPPRPRARRGARRGVRVPVGSSSRRRSCTPQTRWRARFPAGVLRRATRVMGVVGAFRSALLGAPLTSSMWGSRRRRRWPSSRPAVAASPACDPRVRTSVSPSTTTRASGSTRVSKRYVTREVSRAPGRRRGRVETHALRDVRLDVRRGESVGIVGRNGAGKTTLLRVVAGVTAPTSGVARVRGPVRFGLLGAFAALETTSPARENAVLLAAFHGVSRRTASPGWEPSSRTRGWRRPRAPPDLALQRRHEVPARLLDRDPAPFPYRIFASDEALASADDEFRSRARESLRAAQAKGATILVASHDPEYRSCVHPPRRRATIGALWWA